MVRASEIGEKNLRRGRLRHGYHCEAYEARKLARSVSLALSFQHLKSGHCILNGNSFFAGNLTIEGNAFANGLLCCNHAIFQFVPVGLENRGFVRFPPRVLIHDDPPGETGVSIVYVQGNTLSAR